MTERLLCTPHLSYGELAAALQADLERITNTYRGTQFVEPADCTSAPDVAIEARLRILLDAYKNEYHADVTDVHRVMTRICDGRELIWFCGNANEIDRLKISFKEGAFPEGDLGLGTITVISAEEEFGQGYGEACRYGSSAIGTGAKAAYVHCAHELMTGNSPVFGDRYHTLISTTRNRAGTETIAGGEAVYNIARSYVRSRFWGYAPWYVMPGGVLELLELREVNRNPEDVRNALLDSPGWHFANSEEAAYATALVRLNFDVHIPHQIARSAEEQTSTATFWSINPPSEELMRYNHGALIELRNTDRVGMTLSDGIERLEKLSVSCAVVYLSLDDPASPSAQSELLQQGFALSAIVPPKKTWTRSTSGEKREMSLPATGIWSRPRPDLDIAPPYYADSVPQDDDERIIVDYANSKLLRPA